MKNHLLALSLAFLAAACSQTGSGIRTETVRPEPVAQAGEVAPASADEANLATPKAKAPMARSRTQSAAASERLGTRWGDEISSRVSTVDLPRLSEEPVDQTQVLYADKRYRGRAINNISLAAGKIEFVVDGDNGSLPLYREGGRYYLKGRDGLAYRLVYRNVSGRTYEIVASVDGLDVLSGESASRYNRGYVLYPGQTLLIEGFRKSDSAVASFIFGRPSESYAANTPAGSISNTGIIGTAVYELRNPRSVSSVPRSPRVEPTQQAFPADSGYAPPPR